MGITRSTQPIPKILTLFGPQALPSICKIIRSKIIHSRKSLLVSHSHRRTREIALTFLNVSNHLLLFFVQFVARPNYKVKNNSDNLLKYYE